MGKKFKAFDRVLVKDGIHDEWLCDFYSHYNNKIKQHVTITYTLLEDSNILPYEGNENLVGSDQNPDEEVRLEEGELLVCSDDLERLKTGHGVIENFVRTASNEFYIKQGGFCYNFCIRFSDFNPNDMEETSRHILCVKNGKIIRYKG